MPTIENASEFWGGYDDAYLYLEGKNTQLEHENRRLQETDGQYDEFSRQQERFLQQQGKVFQQYEKRLQKRGAAMKALTIMSGLSLFLGAGMFSLGYRNREVLLDMAPPKRESAVPVERAISNPKNPHRDAKGLAAPAGATARQPLQAPEKHRQRLSTELAAGPNPGHFLPVIPSVSESVKLVPGATLTLEIPLTPGLMEDVADALNQEAKKIKKAKKENPGRGHGQKKASMGLSIGLNIPRLVEPVSELVTPVLDTPLLPVLDAPLLDVDLPLLGGEEQDEGTPVEEETPDVATEEEDDEAVSSGSRGRSGSSRNSLRDTRHDSPETA